MGYKQGPIIGKLLRACQKAKDTNWCDESSCKTIVRDLFNRPEVFENHPVFNDIAKDLIEERNPQNTYDFTDKEFEVWGENNIDDGTFKQMQYAMQLPISIRGALMADAHIGYSLPIGGVVATKGAVVPGFVGADIACRMMLSIIRIPESLDYIETYEDEIIKAIEKETRFGMGSEFQDSDRRQHEVMDEDWGITEITAQLKDSAWNQLGSSGGGNHFVDIGTIRFKKQFDITHTVCIPMGQYFAILTHSGSRGAGNKVATHYSKLAQSLHPKIPQKYKHLSWLDMDSEAGQEYWAAMELMGRYASASHHLIHEYLLKRLQLEPIFQVENHHNFAFKEIYNGEELIVHRKGATPASKGVLGIIPGSMATPGYLVEGKGNEQSLNSASHGAGRAMSRTKTKEQTTWHEVKKMLERRGIHLMSAGLDEVPVGYKDINQVMEDQKDLVEVLARFEPKIVKMAEE